MKLGLPLGLAPSPLLPFEAFPSYNACCISFSRPCSILLSAQRHSSPEDNHTPHQLGPGDQTKENKTRISPAVVYLHQLAKLHFTSMSVQTPMETFITLQQQTEMYFTDTVSFS